MPSAVQTYGKIAHFRDFYKISSRSERSQTWCGDYLDHWHCSKKYSLPQQHALRESTF